MRLLVLICLIYNFYSYSSTGHYFVGESIYLGDKVENHDFLLSTPRSGTNWTSAIIQVLTSRNFKHINVLWGIARNSVKAEIDHSKPFVYRHHRSWGILKACPNIDTSKNNLLMVLRNYKEYILRKYPSNESVLKPEDLENIRLELQFLRDNIVFFENWRGKKLLIYYEDLIVSPKKEISKIANFFNASPDLVDNFMENYQVYRERTIANYDSRIKKNPRGRNLSVTKGEHVLYHSKNYGIAFLKGLDDCIKKDFPLYQKYLGRFEEK